VAIRWGNEEMMKESFPQRKFSPHLEYFRFVFMAFRLGVYVWMVGEIFMIGLGQQTFDNPIQNTFVVF